MTGTEWKEFKELTGSLHPKPANHKTGFLSIFITNDHSFLKLHPINIYEISYNLYIFFICYINLFFY